MSFRYPVLILVISIFILSFTNVRPPLQEPWVAPAWTDTIFNPYLIEPLTLPQGQEVFNIYCASCHGQHGEANGTVTPDLKIKPLKFQDKKITSQSDGALYWKITEGKGEMPSFKDFISDEQRWQMVEYIRDISQPYELQQNPLKSAKN